MVNMSQEGLVVATSFHTSWKVTMYYQNGAFLILKGKLLHCTFNDVKHNSPWYIIILLHYRSFENKFEPKSLPNTKEPMMPAFSPTRIPYSADSPNRISSYDSSANKMASYAPPPRRSFSPTARPGNILLFSHFLLQLF